MKPAWMCRTDGCEDERVDGSVWCPYCRSYYEGDGAAALELAAAKFMRENNRRARGKCSRFGCPHPATEGHSLCERCRTTGVRRMKNRAQKRYEAGNCIRCNKPRDDQYRACSACRARERARRASYEGTDAHR